MEKTVKNCILRVLDNGTVYVDSTTDGRTLVRIQGIPTFVLDGFFSDAAQAAFLDVRYDRELADVLNDNREFCEDCDAEFNLQDLTNGICVGCQEVRRDLMRRRKDG